MKTSIGRWLAPLLVFVFVSGPAFASTGLPTTPARETDPAPTTTVSLATSTAPIASTTATNDYAVREKQAQGLENFQGGAGVSIYLGSSAIIIILLIIILVLVV